MERTPGLTMSVSATTRPMRPGEVDGRDYHFIDKAKFEQMVERNELLESAIVFDNRYGTPRAPVEAALAAERTCCSTSTGRARSNCGKRPGPTSSVVFILPPSAADLEKRLHSRAQDSDDVIRGRMSRASHEMSHWPNTIIS